MRKETGLAHEVKMLYMHNGVGAEMVTISLDGAYPAAGCTTLFISSYVAMILAGAFLAILDNAKTKPFGLQDKDCNRSY